MLGRLVGMLALLCAVAPSMAQAGTFSIEDGRYVYEGAPGEANDLHLYVAPSGALAVEDHGAPMQDIPVVTDGISTCLKVKAGFHCQNASHLAQVGWRPTVVLDLGEGDDRVNSALFDVDVTLGSGSDTYHGVFGTWPATGTIDAGPGDDELYVDLPAVTTEVRLGSGNDRVVANVDVSGHFFRGGDGDDTFDITGPRGTFEHSTYAGIYGEDGADLVTRFDGSMIGAFYGGPGGDSSVPAVQWRYDDGRTTGVSATADGVADDGAPGEGDDVPDGIRLLVGTYQDDTLRLGSLRGSLAGLGGNDDLHGGPAAGDALSGGDGDDRHHLDDGLKDSLQCGNGADWADLDAADELLGAGSCETTV